ncbi:MAG: hypothetical protein OQK96_05620 [Gammaproteobacteria bacterium]|nr:hypothetical protein [Gammaproteobacteria bacterium]
MMDDLEKAEKKWASRSLFRSQRRRRRWPWFVLIPALTWLVLHYGDLPLAPS